MTKIKTHKITNIQGYIFEYKQNAHYLNVNWKKGESTWESVHDLNYNIDDFIKELDSAFKKIKEEKKIYDQKKKEEAIYDMIKNKKSAKVEEKKSYDQRKKEEENFIKDAKIDEKKKSVHYENAFQAKRLEMEAKRRTEKEAQLKSEIKKQTFNSELNRSRASLDKINQKKDFDIDVFRKRPQRYYEIDQNIKNTVNVENIKPVKKTGVQHDNLLDLYFDNSHIGRLFDVINIYHGDKIELPKLNCTKIIKSLDVFNFLFTIRQNPLFSKFEIYRAQIVESISLFDDFLDKMKNHSFCGLDTSSSEFVYIFCLYDDFFKIFGFKYDYLIFKFNKKFFDTNFVKTNFLVDIMGKNEHTWNYDRLCYNFYIENYILFHMDELNIKTGGKYIIFCENSNIIGKELNNYLKLSGTHSEDGFNSVDSVFIKDTSIQYLNGLPHLDILLHSNARFFLFKLGDKTKNEKTVEEIFISGGLVTLTIQLLKNAFEIPDLMQVIDSLRNANKWICKVPKKLVTEYGKLINKNKTNLKYTEMQKILLWLETCIEENDASCISEYLAKLKSKYFKKKRYFFILNDKCGENAKTPSEILKYMGK